MKQFLLLATLTSSMILGSTNQQYDPTESFAKTDKLADDFFEGTNYPYEQKQECIRDARVNLEILQHERNYTEQDIRNVEAEAIKRHFKVNTAEVVKKSITHLKLDSQEVNNIVSSITHNIEVRLNTTLPTKPSDYHFKRGLKKIIGESQTFEEEIAVLSLREATAFDKQEPVYQKSSAPFWGIFLFFGNEKPQKGQGQGPY